MSPVLDATVVRTWVRATVDALGAVRAELDAANVFPVPDGDTGTNLLLTFRDGAVEVERAAAGRPEGGADDAAALLGALARGCATGARGNSGVILAEWVRGLGGGLTDGVGADAAARAFTRAAAAAHAGVAEPVEGTILTAATAAARRALRAASRATGTAGVQDVLVAALAGAVDAHARSDHDLPVLAAAGLRDAGAHGLVVVLRELARASGAAERDVDVARTVVSVPSGSIDGPGGGPGDLPRSPAGSDVSGAAGVEAGADGAAGGEFEVMLSLVTGDAFTGGVRPEPAAALRKALAATGDSVAVVGAAPLWRGHVHTGSPVAALAAADEVAGALVCDDGPVVGRGRLADVQVRRLAGTVAGGRPGVVAVCAAPALVAEVARAGAVVLVPDEGGRVTAGALRRASDECTADPVVVAPRTAWAGEPPDAVVCAPTDLHVVAALGGLATSAPATPAEVREVLRVAVAGIRVAAVAGPSDPALDDLLQGASAGALVTLLHGDRVDVDATRAAVVDRVPGAEVVVLASGRDDAALLVGVEGGGA